jgi:IS5 family transposase
MLRIHYLQQWFGLSDPAMEEAVHDVPCTASLRVWVTARAVCPTRPPSFGFVTCSKPMTWLLTCCAWSTTSCRPRA